MWWMHFCYFILSSLTVMVVVDWYHDYRMVSRTCLALALTFLNLVYITLTSLLNIITCITHTWHVYVPTSTQGEPLPPSFLLARIYCRWKCEGHNTERNRIQEVSVAELKNPNLIFQTCALTFNIITVTCSFRILLWHFVHPSSRMIHFIGI